MKRHTIRLLVAAAAWLLFNCGEDTLRGSFVPDPKKEEEPNLGPLSPISVGTQLDYAFQQTFHTTNTPAGGSGLTEGEKKISGRLCLKVDEVQDTATEDYAEAPETVVVGRVKVTGLAADDIEFGDQENAQATHEEVDAWHVGLWLNALGPKTREHGFETPANTTFTTRHAPRPPEQSVSKLPFFEVRADADWGGFDHADAESNFQQDITLGYFVNELDFQGFGSNQTWRWKSTGADPSCREAEDEASCPAPPTCYWRNGACHGRYEVEFAWRTTMGNDAPPLLQDTDVIHWLKLTYTSDGILSLAEEYIVEDTIPDTSLAGFSPTGGCAPCAYASVSLQENWEFANCKF